MTASSVPAPVPLPPGAEVLDDRGSVRRGSVRAGRWSVSGTAKVAGDVEVGEIVSRGQLSVGGKLSAGAFRCRGTLAVTGAVDVRGPFGLHGTMHAASTVHAVNFEVDGFARCAGSLRVDRVLSVDGTLEAPDLTAGALRLQGAARLPGPVRAVEVRADLRETSEFGPVVARVVRLHGRPPNLVDKVRFRDCAVTVQRIEADSVDLEGVAVAFVRSPQIVLGRGCHVTEVEGTVVRQHPSSYVGPESRTPAPFGLRR